MKVVASAGLCCCCSQQDVHGLRNILDDDKDTSPSEHHEPGMLPNEVRQVDMLGQRDIDQTCSFRIHDETACLGTLPISRCMYEAGTSITSIPEPHSPDRDPNLVACLRRIRNKQCLTNFAQGLINYQLGC